jgi:hypothetical protein
MKKNIAYRILPLVLSLLFMGCNDLFELYPQDELLEKDFWQSEDDVEAAVINCYYSLRRCQDEMIVYGLGRSDIIKPNLTEIRNIQKGVFTANYKVCGWERWYELIQAANLVLKKAQPVMDLDPGFTELRYVELMGEVKFMRAFAYFNLIRMWKNVPIVKQPSLNDAQDYFPAKSNNPDEVLNFIEEDLEYAVEHMVDSYPGNTPDQGEILTRARATRGAAWALYSDVLLWRNKYQECILACDQVLNSPLYELLPAENWFDIFNAQKGNTAEAIFELNYDDDYDYTVRDQNSRWRYTLEEWFKDRLRAIPQISVLWRYPDVRYYTLTGTGSNLARKHVGADLAGTGLISENLNPNWIIYRLPHVMFNRIEAMNRLPGGGDINEINKVLQTLENRAGVFDFEPISGGVMDVEEQILEYKLKETAFEGTRWFDLVRIGKRQWAANRTGEENIVVKKLTEIMSDSDKPFVRGNLNNPEGWYLPIHENEILANPNLEQNPYYENL